LLSLLFKRRNIKFVFLGEQSYPLIQKKACEIYVWTADQLPTKLFFRKIALHSFEIEEGRHNGEKVDFEISLDS
jgi:hypothetical protein